MCEMAVRCSEQSSVYVLCIVVAFDNATKSAVGMDVIVKYSLIEVVRLKRQEGILCIPLLT